NSNTATSLVEFYHVNSRTITTATDLRADRSQPTGFLITVGPNQGKVLIAGGGSYGQLGQHTLEVVDPAVTTLVMVTETLPDATTGTPYVGATLSATGGSGTGYVFSIAWGDLPPGMSLTGATIGGQATAAGAWPFVVKVVDSQLNVAYQAYTIAVNKLTITSPPGLPAGTVGVVFNYQLTTAGGVGPVTWSLDNFQTLPAGISLSTSGFLSGIPTAATNQWVVIRAIDATGQVAFRGFNFQFALP